MYLMSFEHKISIAMVLYLGLKFSGQCSILVAAFFEVREDVFMSIINNSQKLGCHLSEVWPLF